MQIDPYLSPCTKLKSKQIKDFNIEPDTDIEEKVRNSLELIGRGKNFLNRKLLAQTRKSAIDKWDLMKLRSFGKAMDTIHRAKGQPKEWEKIFLKPILHLVEG